MSKNKFSFTARLLVALLVLAPVSCGSRQVSAPEKSEDTKVTKENITHQVVVRFKKTITETTAADFAKKYDAKVIKSSSELNSAVFEFKTSKKLEELTKTLNSDTDVDYAEQNSTLSVS